MVCVVSNEATGPRRRVEIGSIIYIDTATRRLRLVRGGHVIYDFPVAVGKPSTPTPIGQFWIMQKTMNPGGVFGTRWMRFTDRAHGIHGTNEPWLIGQAVSNGCVRLRNEDVELLYDQVSIGTPVIVTASGAGLQPQTYHMVTAGESLYGIARLFGVAVESIVEVNRLDTGLLHPGQVLAIPM